MIGLVVVSRLEEFDSILFHEIDQSVLLCDATRPDAGCGSSKWFGLSDTAVGIPACGLNQPKNSKSKLAIVSNPPHQIIQEL